jgi:hypothetical protein
MFWIQSRLSRTAALFRDGGSQSKLAPFISPDFSPASTLISSPELETPTKTASVKITRIVPRQILQTQYSDLKSSPDPGAVVGIVLGSVFGFLLLLYLMFLVTGANSAVATEVIRERPHHHHQQEIVEIVEGPPRPPPVVIAPRRHDDEVIEVIEEGPPPRRNSRRGPPSGARIVDPRLPGGGPEIVEVFPEKRGGRRGRH